MKDSSSEVKQGHVSEVDNDTPFVKKEDLDIEQGQGDLFVFSWLYNFRTHDYHVVWMMIINSENYYSRYEISIIHIWTGHFL